MKAGREQRGHATAGDGDGRELETRLAVAETELRGLKELVAELRASRDSWQAQAERLALPKAETERAIALPGPTARTVKRSWFGRAVRRFTT